VPVVPAAADGRVTCSNVSVPVESRTVANTPAHCELRQRRLATVHPPFEKRRGTPVDPPVEFRAARCCTTGST
jgi:hypothetical protein